MKFLGALIWALGDPDKVRQFSVWHPLFAASHYSKVRQPRYSLLFSKVLPALFTAVVFFVHFFVAALDAWNYVLSAAVLFTLGIFKLAVSRIVLAKELSKEIFICSLIYLVSSLVLVSLL